MITVELCELKIIDDITDERISKIFEPNDPPAQHAELLTKKYRIAKCLRSNDKTSKCRYCVASGQHLVEVGYKDSSSNKKYYRNTYNETSCMCSETKPINDGGKYDGKTYSTKGKYKVPC